MKIYPNKIELILNESDKFGFVSQDKINCAEKELGVIFPYQYRDFLSKYGAVIGKNYEIYGLPEQNNDECPYWQNIVHVTKKMRELKHIGTENHYFIPISSDGLDTYFFLNTQETDKTEIWLINSLTKHIISTDLYDFIEKMEANTACTTDTNLK